METETALPQTDLTDMPAGDTPLDEALEQEAENELAEELMAELGEGEDADDDGADCL